MDRRYHPSTVDRRVSSCHISISGKVRSGCAASSCSNATRPVSGSSLAITIAETPGASSGIRAIRDVTVARLNWQVGRVVGVQDETPHARTLTLDIPNWPGHLAGQHVDVRLVAEDGYQAQRSYSIASPPEEATVALTVERIADGEVSPYLIDVLRPGDGLEGRGPSGGSFGW